MQVPTQATYRYHDTKTFVTTLACVAESSSVTLDHFISDPRFETLELVHVEGSS